MVIPFGIGCIPGLLVFLISLKFGLIAGIVGWGLFSLLSSKSDD